MQRLAQLLVASVVVFSMLNIVGAPAGAADCIGAVTTPVIDGADAAGIGTVLGNNDGLWVIDITYDAKGNLPDQVAVDSQDESNELRWSEGRDVVSLFYVDDEHLITNDCAQLTASMLKSWSEPAGAAGPVGEILGGDWGAYRVVALGSDGLPVAYGFEGGRVEALAICPGEARVAEFVVFEDGSTALAVRSLTDFSITSEKPGPVWTDASAGPSLECADSEAADVSLTFGGGQGSEPGGTPATGETGSEWRQTSSVSVTPNAVSLTSVPPTPAAVELTLDEPPSIGGWSLWLFALGGVGFGLFVLKKSRDPEWRSSWTKPNNARNAGSTRRRDDPGGSTHFGG